MTFQPVKLVHPKTGVVVTATTAVDLTNFRFADGYLPEDVARTLVAKTEGVEEKYPKLVEGVKSLDEIQRAEAEAEKPAEDAPADSEGEKADEGEAKGEDASSTDAPKVASTKTAKTSSRPSTTAKSGTDASGTDVGVS
ncbi:virion structural protein [Gordonia phage Buggaboo]|uniref:Uncharacterized protein n=1 Tax=Gordonia phage Buggaboo TaxID=2315529 RepID=A0A386KE77_9CAUD|nr:virion structural protein [Gordonia phage Buggaboo]AVE00694.1 hypothetical protein SEA_SUPERSULLEY_37 [Gordonia phage SuperSulley]AYD83229.1 hypothetical protein SEA_BUGGABOO_37 [Gordonia phage Buggaboo]